MPKSALLFFDDTSRNLDLRYFCGFEVHDAFIALQVGRKRIGVLNALEFGRALKESTFDQIIPLEELTAAAQAAGIASPAPVDHIAVLAKKLKITGFEVPETFPSHLLVKLVERDFDIQVIDGAVFPGREIKTDAEAKAIREGNRCASAGFTAAETMLRAAEIKGRRLVLDGKTLTSERVRTAIQTACIAAGGFPADTIVAGGDQGCDPHCRGSGPLRPHDLIIIDIFPRMFKTGYWGDMTRTYLRGTANDVQRDLVDAVAKAQKAALAKVKAGVFADAVHAESNRVFDELGYETKRTPTGAVGFFHGTGHGLGLEIHEAPRLGSVHRKLRKGTVVTVEPGLYYPGLGGCRIEDVVQVTAAKPKALSKHSYVWEL
ncbi:M24 family metallopeptidase [Synoicihabitans lomoniglobus]|uniref:M24 family metallopeptidase n=1 Tax=Synoicihabitans lomoniglobus TaxID=2909285 RepID=A0AAF0CQA0_9BACT|nr:M24 family metallopeptidase [Opitutaceae bacterium LMO-M01]WED66064.1 M24 family metallopeptidase [Opitutaceae bacterium LMO-M01]